MERNEICSKMPFLKKLPDRNENIFNFNLGAGLLVQFFARNLDDMGSFILTLRIASGKLSRL